MGCMRTFLSGALFICARARVVCRCLDVQSLVAFGRVLIALATFLVDDALDTFIEFVRRKDTRVFGVECATASALGGKN